MKSRVVTLLLFSALLLAACTPQSTSSTVGSSPGGTTSPTTQTSPSAAREPLTAASISLLAEFVPADGLSYLTYNAPPVLTTYHNQPIPTRDASPIEKMNWWSGFQDYVVAGYSYPAVAEIWGFDAVDLQGMLIAWYQDSSSISVFSGGFSLEKFRTKLTEYRYSEEKYLGYSIYSGVPPLETPLTHSLREFFPRAIGVVDVVKTATDQTSLIVMANYSSRGDVDAAVATVKNALTVFQNKTALFFQTGGLGDLAASLGRVGAAFVGNVSAPDFAPRLKDLPDEQRVALTGPGKLGAYKELAIAARAKGEIIEFTLVYDRPSAAEDNLPILQQRLSEGTSFTGRPLATLWNVENIKAYDTSVTLKATVKLLPQSSGAFIKFNSLIFTQDFLFLAPN